MIFDAERHEVRFWHGSQLLEGEVVVPPGPGPHPAAALVGGAGGRRDRSGWADELASGCGLLTLSWDAPGWGRSPGRRGWQSPDRRALELLAGVGFLAGAQECRDGSVVIAGASAGWAALFAAGLSSRVEALVLISPPGIDAVGHELERLALRLRGRGFISAEVGLAQAVLTERIRRLAAGQDGAAVYASEAACRHAPWYPWLPGTTAEEIESFGAIARLDLHAMAAAVRCPVLAVFGLDEQGARVWHRAEQVRQALGSSPQPDHEVLVMPGSTSLSAGPVWSLHRDGPRPVGDRPLDVVGLISTWTSQRLGRGLPVMARA